MRNNYLTFVVVIMTLLSFNLPNVMAQCAAVGGVATNMPAQILQNGSDQNNLVVNSWSTQPSGTDDHLFVVLSSDVDDNGDNLIVGVSEADGSFDFSNDGTGAAYPLGEYCFRGFSYNQTELDDLAAEVNPLLPLLSVPTIPIPATLSNVFSVLSVLGDLTIPSVITAIEVTLPGLMLDVNLCYAVAETGHCVEVVETITIDPVGIDTPTAVNSLTQVNNFPNPFSGETTISFDVQKAQLVNFNLYDLTGKLIFEKEISANHGTNSYTFSANDLASGMYFYALSNGTTTKTNRMIIE